jgi:NAD(P)-dependent dehydrogenase (short-subunit alcohol dehydrogenase family)
MAPYNCSKAALNQFTRYLAIELGDYYGIRVNAIAPGPTHSDWIRICRQRSGDD